MRLGLLADVHEDVANLETALKVLRREGVDRLILLGDVFDSGHRLDDTVAVLTDAGVSDGVWGNHDYGLCSPSPPELGHNYRPETCSFLRSLVPRIEVDNNLFQHIVPSLDPESIEDLWACTDSEFLGKAEALALSFEANSYQNAFMGHFHRWVHATPRGFDTWDGDRPLLLEPEERHLVVVHAVVDRNCALFDSTTHTLTPFRW